MQQKGGGVSNGINPDAAAPLAKYEAKAAEKAICIINLIEKLVKLNI